MDNILLDVLDCLKYLNVLTITLTSYNALRRPLSSVRLPSCTKSLLLKGFHESTALNISDLAALKHLYILDFNDCWW